MLLSHFFVSYKKNSRNLTVNTKKSLIYGIALLFSSLNKNLKFKKL